MTNIFIYFGQLADVMKQIEQYSKQKRKEAGMLPTFKFILVLNDLIHDLYLNCIGYMRTVKQFML